MSEFLKNVSDSELVNLAKLAEDGRSEVSEAFLREELHRRQMARLALSQGVYDASQDQYEVTEHPEDSKWAVEPFNNPCIELGED